MNQMIVVAVAALAGAAFGVVADRLSVRWPEHLPDYQPRPLDWRTAVVALTGAIAAGGLVARSAEPLDLLVLLPFAAALLVLLATDLDQKILSDLITLPLIAFAAAVLLANLSPFLADKPLGLVSGIAAGIGAPLILLVTDRVLHGDLGMGDLKLAVSLGLMLGISLLFYGVLLASIGFAAVLVLLIVLGRLSLRSAVPFGPVLIFGAFVAALLG